MLKSPYSFFDYITRDRKKLATEQMKIGSAVHTLLLEKHLFPKLYVAEPRFVTKKKNGEGESHLTTEAKAMKAAWKESLDPAAVVLTEENFQTAYSMVESVYEHPHAKATLEIGKPELSGYYRDPETGIKCRIRPDLYVPEYGILLDVKTTEMDCSAEAFSRNIWSWRYDFQMGMYCEGIKAITGHEPKLVLFLVIESKPPYEVCLYECDQELLDKGKKDYRIAINRLKSCLITGKWDRIQNQTGVISLPPWALK
jgi:hypothetical protein